MIVTERDHQILLSLTRYGLLNRGMVQKMCFPNDPQGRVARRRLAVLTDAGFIRRHSMLVASRFDDPPAPVYLMAKRGYELLAQEGAGSGFPRKPVQLPHPLHVRHALAVAEMHVTRSQSMPGLTKMTL